MAPRAAPVLASFAVAFCAVVPCLGDEPAELPPLPAPVLSTVAPAPSAATAPSAVPGGSAAPSAAPAPGAPTRAEPGPSVQVPGGGGRAPSAESTAAAPAPASPASAAVGVTVATPGGESRSVSKTRRIRGSTWSLDTSLGAMAVGGGLVGAGWVLSVLHGVVGEIAGIDCGKASGGYTATISCRGTDDYSSIYIPVVGPFLEAATHRGTLSDADKGFLVIEGILQAGGAVTALVGLVSLPVTLNSENVSVTVAPVVSAGGAGLGVTGSF